MRPLRIAVDMGLLIDMEVAESCLAAHEPAERAFCESLLSQMIRLLLKQRLQEVEFYWLTDCSDSLFQALALIFSHQRLEGHYSRFTNKMEMIRCLDRCDVYFSQREPILSEARKRGIFGGYFPAELMKKNLLSIAFDHRIFMEDSNLQALKSWLRLLGALQKDRQYPIRVALITTSSASVEKRVITLFQGSECRIQDVFYLSEGGKEELFRYYGPALYFEGGPRRQLSRPFQPGPLLFI